MWEILAALFVGTAVSGVLPIVNAELLVVAAAAAVPGLAVPLVAAVSTAGQMSSKTLLFGLARWAPARLPKRARSKVDKASEAISQRGGTVGSLVFVSATVGLPPLYGVSLACGALRVPVLKFIAFGSAGRALRFGILAWVGQRFGAAALDILSAHGLPWFLGGG